MRQRTLRSYRNACSLYSFVCFDSMSNHITPAPLRKYRAWMRMCRARSTTPCDAAPSRRTCDAARAFQTRTCYIYILCICRTCLPTRTSKWAAQPARASEGRGWGRPGVKLLLRWDGRDGMDGVRDRGNVTARVCTCGVTG
jgi:hypothetical protein